MKRFTTLITLLLCVATLFAQAPEKFTYQAVVRNASNALATSAQVGVRVNILQGSVTGNAVYSESHVVTTNANGLVTVNIGGGSVLHGSFAGINWAEGPYFLKTDIDPNGGNDYSITSVQQLLSVPYALYATEAANGFSGDYNDLTNTPTIPTVPTDVSAFNNDAGYITVVQVPAQVNADWNATSGSAEIFNKPTIPSVPTNVSAFTNDAGYITGADIPAIPSVPTNVSAFTNDAGYLTSYTETDPQFNAWDKDYDDLINKPVIPTVPANVSAFTNDAGYLTSFSETDPQFNAWDKDYNDLINKPVIPTVPTNVSAFNNDAGYITVAQVPAQVNADWTATTGAAQILNKPTIPTNVSAFNNDAGYITVAQVPSQVNADWSATTGAAQILNKPTLFSGNYNDLTNKPTIPTVPMNVSAFNNDAGYITSADIPTVPTIPTNVSAFTNDAGYVTAADVQQAAGIPANVSAFTNDAGYITADNVPAQVNADWNATSGVAKILNKPSNVSAFDNDAHYITAAELNALLAELNNTIDSLRDRIEELENGGTPVPPDPVTPDTSITPGTPVSMDGLACPGTPTVTDWDGNVYNTVAIGQQCWMKENLRTTKYADGQSIPLATTGTSTTDRYRYYPGNNSSNLGVYGFVYNWPAVMYGSTSSNTNPSNVRGICPTGWHMPSNLEWTQLNSYVSNQMDNRCGGNSQNIAKALASTTNWISNSISCTVGDYAPNNNTTGFSALPAGDNTGDVGTYANFWSCTQSDNSIAYAVQLGSTSTVVTVNADATKDKGYSVRCVRDSAITAGVAQMVVTGNVSGITTNSASSGGTVNSSNGLQVNERGVCWSQMPNPNIDGDHMSSGSGTGSFTVSINGLQPSTTYYVRAYATTNAGTLYGNTQTFTTQNDASDCGIASVTDYDGNTYNTVKIGDQCWMKENLRTTHYADGTTILAGSTHSWPEAHYYSPNGTSAYGYLYNWPAAMHGVSSSSLNPSNVRGICPIGWHMPSDAEWSQLIQFVGSQSEYCCSSDITYIAKALAAQTGWNTSTTTCAVGNELSTNNNTGFSALPAGYCAYDGYYESGGRAIFWATGYMTCCDLRYNDAKLFHHTIMMGFDGCSVRCLRD